VDLELEGKVAVVTGASKGIGRAVVRTLASEGMHVIGGARTVESLDGIDGVTAVALDLVDRAGSARLVDTAVEQHGRIDVLVNNACIVRDSQLVKWKDGVVGVMEDAAFDAVVNVNLKGVFVCTRAVVPHMIRAGRGVILNASSIVGLYGNFGQTNYAATKAGVISFTQTWSRELGRYGIRVNAVAPGFIATEMIKAMPPKVLESMAAKTPLGRMGEPDDIANAYVWLASDAANFVSGAVLSVDGGLVLGT